MKSVFDFHSNEIPFQPIEGEGSITPEFGQCAEGWLWNLPSLTGLQTGFVDLGYNGKITVNVPLPDANERTVTVTVRYYKDAALYSTSVPVISVPGWQFVSSQVDVVIPADPADNFFGSRFDETKVQFRGSGTNFIATIASPSEMPFDVLIDKVEVSSEYIVFPPGGTPHTFDKDALMLLLSENAALIQTKQQTLYENVTAMLTDTQRTIRAQLMKLTDDINKLVG